MDKQKTKAELEEEFYRICHSKVPEDIWNWVLEKCTLKAIPIEAPVMQKIAEDETDKEYWRKKLRNRYDPIIAFNIGDHNPNIEILKEVAKEEGCLTTYRATEGYLEGMFAIVFSGLYTEIDLDEVFITKVEKTLSIIKKRYGLDKYL
jgi:hypothetical protein